MPDEDKDTKDTKDTDDLDNQDKAQDKDTKSDDSTANKETTYNLKISGEERQVTLDEMKEMASRSGGADKKFRDAAESLKKAEKWGTVGDLFTKISDPNNPPAKEEVAQLAALLGLDPKALLSILAEEEGNNENTGSKNKGKEKPAGDKKLDVKDLPDEVQAVLQGAKKSQIEAAIAEVKSDVGEALDKDEIIGKMVVAGDDTSGLKNALSEMIFEDVQRRILAGEQYGPELVKTSVQKARTRLSKFSTQGKKSESVTEALGMLGLGPSGEFPAEVQADKPIDRVPSTDTKYEENFKNRFLQQVLGAVRNKKS